MAEASRILQTTLIPTFSQNPSLHRIYLNPCFSPLIFKRNKNTIHTIRWSVSTTSTGSESATKIGWNSPSPWGCDIDSLENASALQEWLSASGLPPQKMGIQRVDVGERGLVASNNIRKGEKLLFVPPSLFITADSIKDPNGQQIHDFRGKTSEKFDFVAQKKGLYRFCFKNKSPYHETIDFDVHVGHATFTNHHAKDEYFKPLLEQISTLQVALYNIQFEQHWLEAQSERQTFSTF